MINTSAQNTLKNSTYNILGFIIPIIILIIFTPIIISKLGIKDYGVFIFLNTILMFLSLLDLGIGIATSKHAVEYYSTNQIDKLKNLLHSMNSVYFIQALLYLFICIIIGIIMQTFFIKETTSVNYFILLSIIGLTGFVSTIFANFINSFSFMQRYDIYFKINNTFLLISNISILILATCGYKLIPILLSQLILAIISGLTYLFLAKKTFPILEFKYIWNKEELIKNYKFALPVALNNLVNSSLVHFDKLLIPIYLGAAPLTYYSVPGSIATKISSISGTLSSLLFPITVNLHSLNNHEKIKRVYTRSVRLITILSSAIALSIIFTADKILLYWLGESFAIKSTTVLIVLVLTNFVLALFSPLSNLLMATNKMKFLTIGSSTMAVINILALLVLLPRYGINGAAFSYLISVLFIFFMSYYAEKKYFKITNNIHLKLYLKIFATTIPFFLLVKYLFYPQISSLLTLVIIGPACVLIFLLIYKVLGFVETEDWDDFKLFMRRILEKLNINHV